jgi:beta-lactamase superfamily II metal-dependent hydrolase
LTAADHPNPATVQRYAAKNLPLFRTDINGGVTVSTDGYTLLTREFASSGMQ